MQTDGIPSASPPVTAPVPGASASRGAAQTGENAQTSRVVRAQDPSPWREAGQKYNVRSMSLAEMDEMTMQLYQGGAISLSDRALLTLDPTRVPVAGQRLSEDSIRLTKADAQGRRDWIAEYELQKARAEALGETQNAANDQRLLDVLRRVQAGGAPALSREV